jgi:cell division protease FtsH
VELVEADAVVGVTLDGTRLTGTLGAEHPLHTVDGEDVTSTEFVAQLPFADDASLLALLSEHGVEVTVSPRAADRTWWWSLLLGVAPFLLLFGFWIWMAQRMRGSGPQGLLSLGRSGARLYDHTREQITFDDVAGARGAKQELREIIDFLRTPERFRRLGAEIPRGVLLVGPPGTGKTLLAKAVAGEAGVPFFSITGSDFLEMFVGVGPKRVRDLFESAKAVAPSIIFIDELDAIGGRRGLGIWSGGTDERERTLNQLLSEMSGFEPSENVIVMAATNRPDVLDAALLRPGRFDRRIMVDLPMQEDREQILRLHARQKPLAPDVDLKSVAAGTPGFSGADLRNLLNEAAILAAREGADVVTGDDIEKARDKILMGLEREGLALTERERKFLSYHEAGHAVLAAVLPHTDPLHKVTIVPRGRAMGVTQQLPEREKYVYEREYILDRVVVMMGGRAAEEIVFRTATSGAEDDLRQASMLVRRMVQDWGMSDALGPFVAERPREQPFLGGPTLEPREYSDETARRVDEAVEHILGECYDRAVETLRAHRGDLDRVAARLLEVEELSGEEVGELLGPVSADDADSPRARPPGAPPQSAARRRTSRSTS